MLMQSLVVYYSHALIVSNVGSLFRPYCTSLFTQSMTLILDFLSLSGRSRRSKNICGRRFRNCSCLKLQLYLEAIVLPVALSHSNYVIPESL